MPALLQRSMEILVGKKWCGGGTNENRQKNVVRWPRFADGEIIANDGWKKNLKSTSPLSFVPHVLNTLRYGGIRDTACTVAVSRQ